MSIASTSIKDTSPTLVQHDLISVAIAYRYSAKALYGFQRLKPKDTQVMMAIGFYLWLWHHNRVTDKDLFFCFKKNL